MPLHGLSERKFRNPKINYQIEVENITNKTQKAIDQSVMLWFAIGFLVREREREYWEVRWKWVENGRGTICVVISCHQKQQSGWRIQHCYSIDIFFLTFGFGKIFSMNIRNLIIGNLLAEMSYDFLCCFPFLFGW